MNIYIKTIFSVILSVFIMSSCSKSDDESEFVKVYTGSYWESKELNTIKEPKAVMELKSDNTGYIQYKFYSEDKGRYDGKRIDFKYKEDDSGVKTSCEDYNILGLVVNKNELIINITKKNKSTITDKIYNDYINFVRVTKK